MYRVAIADDETNIREGLRDLVDWNGLGFTLTGVFDDGDGLVSLLQRTPLDLIVTDIKMNRRSGLDVSQYIQQNKLDTRVVLISGYKEADLAMSAIKYGVRNYILKPVDLDELTDCICRVRDELDAQHRVQLQQAALTHARSEMSSLLSLLFDELLHGTLQNRPLVKRMFSLLYPDLPFERSACFSLVLRIRSYDGGSFIRSRTSLSETDPAACINDFSAENGSRIEARLVSRKENQLLLFGLLRECPDGPIRNAVTPDIDALCRSIRSGCGLSVEVDSLETFASIPAMLGSFTQTTEHRLADALEELNRRQNDLYAVLSGGDEAEVEQAAEYFSDYLSEMEFPSACDTARNVLYTVSVKLRRDALPTALALDGALLRLEQARDHTALRRAVLLTFREIGGAISESGNGFLENAQAYILEHIGEDISLENIADHFYLSQYHFSRTFKAKTGETFIHFATRCKIEYAAQLLSQTDSKIYDVCERVGYKSLRHFSKLFKAYTGMSPSSYRQQMRMRESSQ